MKNKVSNEDSMVESDKPLASMVPADGCMGANLLGWLCLSFRHAASIGFAIFDERGHYQHVNGALAAINGISSEAHLGYTIEEVLGPAVARQNEPFRNRLMANGKSASIEVNALLPTRSEPGSWLSHYFALEHRSRRITGVGVIVVEITMQRRLLAVLDSVTGPASGGAQQNGGALVHEAGESLGDYLHALNLTIGALARSRDGSCTTLSGAVESLDRRILAVRNLLHAVTTEMDLPLLWETGATNGFARPQSCGLSRTRRKNQGG